MKGLDRIGKYYLRGAEGFSSCSLCFLLQCKTTWEIGKLHLKEFNKMTETLKRNS
jgi:hypothetical protein